MNVAEVCDRLLAVHTLETEEDTATPVEGVYITDKDEQFRVFGLMQYYVEMRTSYGELSMDTAVVYGVKVVNTRASDTICIGCTRLPFLLRDGPSIWVRRAHSQRDDSDQD